MYFFTKSKSLTCVTTVSSYVIIRCAATGTPMMVHPVGCLPSVVESCIETSLKIHRIHSLTVGQRFIITTAMKVNNLQLLFCTFNMMFWPFTSVIHRSSWICILITYWTQVWRDNLKPSKKVSKWSRRSPLWNICLDLRKWRCWSVEAGWGNKPAFWFLFASCRQWFFWLSERSLHRNSTSRRLKRRQIMTEVTAKTVKSSSESGFLYLNKTLLM